MRGARTNSRLPLLFDKIEMTNYEKIKFLLEMNVYDGVEVVMDNDIYPSATIIWLREDGHFKVNNDISPWIVSKELIEHCRTISITPIVRVPKMLPIGTKVRVAKKWIYANRNYISDRHKKIRKITAIYEGYELDNWDMSGVPPRAVIPVFEDLYIITTLWRHQTFH